MRLSFAVAALFGMAVASIETVAEPELTFPTEEETEQLWLAEETEMNAQTHAAAQREVNRLAQIANAYSQKVKTLTGEEKRLKRKNLNLLMKKAAVWKRMRATHKAKFQQLVKNMKKNARVISLKGGRKQFKFLGEASLSKQIDALKASDRRIKFTVKRDLQAWMANERKINASLKKKYMTTIKGTENQLKAQAKKTVRAVKNDINMVEDNEVDFVNKNRMSLIETIACSAVFVFSCAALAAAALYDPKTKAQAKKQVVVDNESAPAHKKQIKKSLDSILKNNNTKVTLM